MDYPGPRCNLRQKEPDTHLDHCLQQRNLGAAIRIAAESIDIRNKINSHQKRIGKKNLKSFADKLVKEENNISRATDFDEIFEIVQNVKSDKIGELAIYDTAFRISCYRNIFPEKIYLHSGTRTGARNLIGRLNGKRFLAHTDFPPIFKDLPASDLEDILCIYKKEFAACILK